jgi:hypothetical protein
MAYSGDVAADIAALQASVAALSGSAANASNVGQAWSPSPAYVSGNYYVCTSQTVGTSTSATLGIGTLRLAPFVVVANVNIVRLFGEHTVAGDASSALRIAVYDDDGTGNVPSTLIVDAGTIPMTGAAAVQEVTVNINLTPGLYWVGGAVQGATSTQPTVRCVSTTAYSLQPLPQGTSLPAAGSAVTAYGKTAQTGAFPNPLTSPVVTSAAPRIGFKVA